MNDTATYSTPCRAQFRAMRVVICGVSEKEGNGMCNIHADSPNITPPFSATSSHVSSLAEESIFSKSSAQVATLVAPQVVQPESGELKLDPKGRSHPLGVRFSETELALVKAKAKAAGCSTNGYIRAASLGSDYKPPHDPEWTRELHTANRELTAQGNNINQIAKQVNSCTASATDAEGMVGIIARSILQTHRAVRKALAQGKEPEV